VNFAEPLSMKAYLSRKGLSSESPEDQKRRFVADFAHQIATAIEEVSIATAPALVATGLLSSAKRGIGVADLYSRIELIRKALDLRNVPFSEPLQTYYPKALHNALNRYAARGILKPHHDGVETFYTLSFDQRVRLDYYKNSLMHNLVHLSIASALFLQARSPSLSEEQIEAAYNRWKDFFSHEFIQILNYHEALADLKALGVVEDDGNGMWRVLNPAPLETFSALLQNFWEAYELTVRALLRLQFVKLDEKSLVKRILEMGQNLLLKGDLNRPEALSRFTVHNALLTLRDRGLVLTHEKEMGKIGRQLFSSAPNQQGLERMLQEIQGELFSANLPTGSLYLMKE
jgi:glycerol-3-phosphate O-acyltransferase